jgi:hypothetical protein
MSNGITLESLHNDIVGLRTDVGALRQEVRLDIVRLEAKVDSKPSLMAMFTAVIVVVFGMAGVIASTITTLHILGLLLPPK